MGKSAPVPAPPPFSPIDPLKDAFLFAGDFKILFYICLVGFCLANARVVLGATPKINYFHGCAMMVLICFGGSTISAAMVGAPVAFVANEALVPVCLATWTVVYFVGSSAFDFVKTSAVGVVLQSTTYEIMRCHVLMNCTKQAAALLPGALVVPSAGRVAIVGPLIAGTLGGCGGAFMPLNKGLDPLAAGTNWRISSAMISSLWLFLSMQYPDSKSAIGLDGDTCRFLTVSFVVVVPLVQYFSGIAPLGANPLIPAKSAVTAGKKTK